MGGAPAVGGPPRITLRNEFANIRLTLEHTRCGARLLVEDRETGAATYLDPIELAGLCLWPEERRAELLQIGIYAYDDTQEGADHARR
ncbi:hypothetical protein HGA13_05135 [Nocardia speluncae]|uniref:Uncharacterized protein n=2 Tax=Nocardia speluncae TaxID=419477 RepID=A0A846XCF8_9NOCA|nr:hypothetical protein [Nocardia speluncae]NKY32460.1 hypothetical protein [Nocardia speluncae]